MTSGFFHEAAGIRWYCEMSGRGPHVVLVPSGEGDCGSYSAVAANLSADFTVLTFDAPGFSRTSGPTDQSEFTIDGLSGQIAVLVESLGIPKATFFGSSSGGCAVLNLLLDHPEIVRNAIVHEAAIADPGAPSIMTLMEDLPLLTDDEIVASCEPIFSTLFVEDGAAWASLGKAFHGRVAKNYVTWIRQYWSAGAARRYDPRDLKGRPLAWTIGGLTPAMGFLSNVRLALAAGNPLDVLMCKHFPHVTVPGPLADHIRQMAAPYVAIN